MKRDEIYVSVDVEADGPVPGLHSMLSLGAAAFKRDKTMIDTFSVNLETLPGATAAPDTMQWWATQPTAWAAHRQDIQDPAVAMQKFAAWITNLPGTPVFVGYPASFDFGFSHWYLTKFVGHDPFGFNALDIKSYAMAVLKTNFKTTVKKKMPKHWFSQPRKHNHVALVDAIEQGELFVNILEENSKIVP